MRGASLLPLVLWTAAVHAFYPFFPTHVCKWDKSCKTSVTVSARTEPQSPALPGAGRTLKLRRGRLPRAPQTDRVVRHADRLAQKHAGSAATATLKPRSNTFDIAEAATPTGTHAVGIDQDGTDFSYFVEMAFGSNSTPMYMLLDSGSSSTWVMGSDCTSAACASHNTFGAADSSTLEASARTFSIAYGSGKVAGSLVTDTVALAGLTTSMTFGLANTTSSDFTQFPFDGILGMGLSMGSTNNFWQTVGNAKLLSANLFAVSLWRDDDGGTNDGELLLGATDASRYTGSIGYTAVSSSTSGSWAIALDDVGFGSARAQVNSSIAYIDTGTTYAFGPPDDVAALHALIPGASSSDDGTTFSAPCSTVEPVTVVFSGIAYNISAKDWLSANVDDSGNCTSNIYGVEVVSGAWLFGDLYLKNVYSVFDVDNKRIGFANKAVTATATSASASATAAALTTTLTGVPGLTGQESDISSAITATATGSAATTQAASPASRQGSPAASVVGLAAAIVLVLTM